MNRFFVTTALVLALLPAQLALSIDTKKPPAVGPVGVTPPGNITFQSDLAKAIELGRSQKRVVAAYFTAAWCGYCRKMESVSFADSEVKSYASKFVWVKIDIDTEPAYAQMFGVRGVPAFGFLNIRGELLEMAGGYRSPGQFVELLKRNADKIEAPGKAKIELEKTKELLTELKKAKRPDEVEKAVVKIVTLLASPDRRQRKKAKDALISAEKRAWPGLLSCLSDRRLAVRAAAFDLLSEATAKEFPFDAFASLKTRGGQIETWTRYVSENTAVFENAPVPENEPAERERQL